MNIKRNKGIIFQLLFCLSLLKVSKNISAQNLPFYNDVQSFKKQDSIHFPPKNAILFIGSSSFTKWKDVQDYFPNYPIINRAFGGSILLDQIHYVNDIVFPYQPKQIVIYCGDNDLASSDTITPQIVLNRFKTLFELIRNKLKTANIVYVSIKPSPSRIKLLAKDEITNQLIKDYLSTKKNTAFVDVYHPMMAKNNRPIPQIFIEDSLHMNGKGYAIWQKIIQPYLKK